MTQIQFNLRYINHRNKERMKASFLTSSGEVDKIAEDKNNPFNRKNNR